MRPTLPQYSSVDAAEEFVQIRDFEMQGNDIDISATYSSNKVVK